MAEDKPTIEELEHIIYHKDRMAEERAISDAKYADKEDFNLVQKIVFGTVALILVSVVGAIIALVVI